MRFLKRKTEKTENQRCAQGNVPNDKREKDRPEFLGKGTFSGHFKGGICRRNQRKDIECAFAKTNFEQALLPRRFSAFRSPSRGVPRERPYSCSVLPKAMASQAIAAPVVHCDGKRHNLKSAGNDLETRAQNDPKLLLLQSIPSFAASTPDEREALFRRKAEACCAVTGSSDDSSAEKLKRETLMELTQSLSGSDQEATSVFCKDTVKAVFEMVSSHIFCKVPFICPPGGGNFADFEDDDDELLLDSSWSNLETVYQFFFRLILSSELDWNQAKLFIDKKFLAKFLKLFLSGDPRERNCLKTILHRIYARFTSLRPLIREAIQDALSLHIYSDVGHRGVSELLEILGSIVTGFSIPLKEEHKTFLQRYVLKDPALAVVIVQGILKFWPLADTHKEIIMLSELEAILEVIGPLEFQQVVEPVGRKIAECIRSPHFQIAEKVLFFWQYESIAKLFYDNREQLYPVLVTALFENSRNHWSSLVNGLSYNVSRLLMEGDKELFYKCSAEVTQAKNEKQKSRRNNELAKVTWNKLAESYKARFKSQTA